MTPDLLTTLYDVEEYIDTFAPGHYARVLAAQDRRRDERIALKVLRPEHLEADGGMRWEYRAFASEVDLLQALKQSPHVVPFYDCGFIESTDEAPTTGEIVSFKTDVAAFTGALSDFAQRGWRPYLTMQFLPRTDNLFYLMRPSQSGTRRRLPTEEGLSLALQFANVLALAHSQHIVYLDHKLEHVYWDGNTLRIIDFNSSRRLLGNTNESNEYIKDIHNLCVGVLYPVFTGMSPQKTTLRPQPGGQETVDSRYDDIDQLDFVMEPLLSDAVAALLQRGASQQIATVQDFIASLQSVGALHGRDFPTAFSNPASRQARDQVVRGLRNLREGETKIREARDLFREALILDGLTEDLEDELRRLVKQVNEMLNHRAIP